MPKELYRTGMAYGISKNFVVWLSQFSAAKFGAKGARILSVSPGVFDTEMGRLEEKSGSADMLKTAALKRFGKPHEIAAVLAFCASEKAGYLTGTDVLCDGGVIAGQR
jgi:NAD(P)-dependent dehydrogenase (short-subunit alcohol dehydrogenase family)